MIEFCNSSKSKVVSLDTPSGLNLNGGKINNFVVKADFTITLALHKMGLKSEEAEGLVGKLF